MSADEAPTVARGARTHVVLCPAPLWGHIRPLAVLAARMAALRPRLVLTLFVAAKYAPGARAEVARDRAPEDGDVGKRIRFVSVEYGPYFMDHTVYIDSFLQMWGALVRGGALRCEEVDGTPSEVDLRREPPRAVVIDIVLPRVFSSVRAQRTGFDGGYKMYTWAPSASACLYARFHEDPTALLEALAAQAGVSLDEAAFEVVNKPTGMVMRCACLPDMHDYEWSPQAFYVPPGLCGDFCSRVPRTLKETDGLLTFDAADFHPEATAVCRAWFAESGGRRFVYAGPLVARGDRGGGEAGSERGTGVMRFLDGQVARSVIYISFGSLHWPSDAAKLHAVLEEIVDCGIPLVLTHGGADAEVQEETRAMLDKYEGGFVSEWAPQTEVLAHPAVGWCLTHAGHNTVLECLLAGVPMITWPVFSDQPSNAIHLADDLRVAFELLEVRHGHGLGKICRSGYTPVGTVDAVRAEVRAVLERAFGEEGEGMRERAREMGKRLGGAWGVDGAARNEVDAFLDELVAVYDD
ncbi:UDP-Glycosyltransferase/glycogen phosphorylase [Trametes elegans]|nr:UDP-Glycosyltransferase/glycogen phosphorylase [Trametes elegans]